MAISIHCGITSLLFGGVVLLVATSCAKLKDFKHTQEGNAFDMSRKGLTEFPDEVFLNKDVKVIRLFGNQIDSIPDRISELTSLEKLYLGKNNLTYIPASIGELKNLKILSLQYNELDSLPNEISDLVALEQLLLNQNTLMHLPDSIGKLKKLEVLQVKFNQLEALPESIGQCEELAFIYLNRNNLDSLPVSMSQLTSLKELYLSGAGLLLQVPEEMCDLRYFELIEIDGSTALPACMYVLQANRLQIVNN